MAAPLWRGTVDRRPDTDARALKRRFSALLVLGWLSVIAFGGPAAGQSVDHGAMEQLFGEPVTTSAIGRPQKMADAPANMVIISQDEIRRSGATNLPDVLRFVTGLDIRRYGAMDADVAVHGYNQPVNPRLLVLLNGRTVYNDIFGFVSWQLIPVQLDEIRQIEVVKGPNSALFGFNAASGVVNIVTYDPLDDQVNAMTVRAGSRHMLEGSAVASARIPDKAGIRMSLGGARQNEYKPGGLPPESIALLRAPRASNFSIDTEARIAPGVEVTFEATKGMIQSAQSTIGGTRTLDTFHANSVRAGVMAETPWGVLAVEMGRNWFGSASYSFLNGPAVVPISNRVYFLQASDTVRLSGNHIIRVSLEVRDNAAVSDQVFGGTIGYRDYAVSGMWDWRITQSLSLTNSVRLDYLALRFAGNLIAGNPFTPHQLNGTAIIQPSFNTGLVYKLTSLDTIRLTAARGLQAPSLYDFGLQFPGGPGPRPAVIGSPSLRATAVWNVEFGYDREIPAIGATARGAVFVQRNDNLLSPAGTTLPGVLPNGLFASVAGNVGYSDALGAEIGIKGQSVAGVRWQASYSLMGIADHTSLNKVFLTSTQNYQNGSPVHVVIAGAGYTREKWEMDVLGRWQSRFSDQRATLRGLVPMTVDDYVTVTARIGYRVTDHVTLALTAQQLNAPRVVQSAGPPVERSLIGTLTARF